VATPILADQSCGFDSVWRSAAFAVFFAALLAAAVVVAALLTTAGLRLFSLSAALVGLAARLTAATEVVLILDHKLAANASGTSFFLCHMKLLFRQPFVSRRQG
jgi:hypothetical protein